MTSVSSEATLSPVSTLKPIRFDDFELDEGNASLVRDGTPITLPPKAFSLLCELVRHAGRLATKNDLLDAVWGHRHVSESVLKSTVALVRAALSDDAGEPRYIETVARRGYRFIGRISQTPLPIPALPAHPISPASAMIGRLDALSRLQTAWQNAAAGRRQLIWISGDAGAGKTTLVDRFTRDIQPGRLAHGQCVEQFGAGEPYLPVLEALRNLSKQGPELVTLMRRVAPMWLLQMPWLLADSDRATLRAELAGTGQERMLREMWELMESYSAERPLLLITEDLHWSDQGTLRLMEHFAR